MSTLLVIAGPPCSGKSTLASVLAPKWNAIRLDVDDVRQEVLPESTQSRGDRDIAYRCMHMAAKKLVEGGIPMIVLVATYRRKETRQWFMSLAQSTASSVGLIECHVDPNTAVERLRQRGPGHAAVDLTEDGVRDQAAGYAYGGGFLVDMTTPIDECIQKVERAVLHQRAADPVKWARQGAA